jgi:trimeric autotransporter adhesin
VHPTALSNYFLTGAQDNGAQRFQYAGINITDEVTGGDGAYCHIDQEDPDTQMTAYTYNNIRISTNGFSSYTSSSSSKGNFINASDYDSENKILYAGSDNAYLYRWAGVGGSLTATNISISAMNSKQASAILVSPFHPKTVYVGTEGGRVVKVSNANGGSPSGTNISTGLPTGTVSCIAMDPQDSTHLLVTYSNYGTTSVYESVNSGTSWVSVEGNLPDMPIRWAIFSPIGGDSAMLATELGVWSTTNLDSGSTSWAATNTGLANCRVDMLQYRPSDSLIVAATHGRGVFTTRDFSERVVGDFGAENTLVYTGQEVEFFDDSYGATSWSWDFDGDGIAESTAENPTYTYGDGGLYTVKLTINGSITKTRTNYIQVIPNQGIPYTTSDGGDMESNTHHFGGKISTGSGLEWERGAPSNHFTSSYYNGSNAWVTDLDADIPELTVTCELLTPCFNFSAAGTYTLSFVRSQQTYYSNAPAAGVLYYSTDKGLTWTKLGTSSSGGTNWYGSGVSTSVYSDGEGWIGNKTKSTSSHTVSSLAGNSSVCFKFEYKVIKGFTSGSGYAIAGFLVDDFAISGPANDSITGAGIESAIAERTLDLGPNDSANFYSPSGKIIAKIWNNSTHDFGNTKVEIDAVGTTPVNFDTNTTSLKKIFGKTIKITPTSNSTTKDVKIAMYFSSAELTAWKSATGLYANDIQLLKTTGAIESSSTSQGVEPTATTVDSTFNGTGLCITGTFSNGFSGVGGGGGANGVGNPLPVTLLEFEAKRYSKQVVLNWVTSSETNNAFFDVERSMDGDEFEKIGRVSGNGTSTERLEYELIDKDNLVLANNRLCYRLRQVDFDGAYELSDIVCADKSDIRIDLTVGPNPAINELRVSINPWLADLYTLELFDMNGNMLLSRSQLTDINKIDVSELSSGVYFVNIKRNDASVLVEKIVKQ